MLLSLWLHSRVGKSTPPPSLGHETHEGKDKVHSQPICPQPSPGTHAHTRAHQHFSCGPPQCLHFPVPTAQQLSCNTILRSLQPSPGAEKYLQHLPSLPGAPKPQHEGSQKAQVKLGSSEGACPEPPETPLGEQPPSERG